MVSIPSHFRGRARRDAAAFYLTQLAQGILRGELGILTGHETVTVRPTDSLVLEPRTVDVHLARLRAKCVAARLPEPAIETVRGVGYRYRESGRQSS